MKKIILLVLLSLSIVSADTIMKEIKKAYYLDNLHYDVFTKDLANGIRVVDSACCIIQVEFKDGIANGEINIFDKKGRLIRSSTYLNGKQNGLEESWNEYGVKESSIIYNDNIIYKGWIKSEHSNYTYENFKKTGFEIKFRINSTTKYKTKPFKYKYIYKDDIHTETIALDEFDNIIEKL